MELSTQLLVTEHRRRVEPGRGFRSRMRTATRRVHDKGFLTAFAHDHGIECPATFFPTGPEDAATLAGDLPYPVLVKPRHSSGGRGIRRVERRADFVGAYAMVHATFPAPIVQECLPPGGDALGVAVLMNFASAPRASFAYRRLREYPASRRSEHAPREHPGSRPPGDAERLLSSLGLGRRRHGRVQGGPAGRRPKLLEVNPRFWGSLHHAILCGVDFPWLLCRMAMDGDVDRVSEYRVGVQSRSLLHGEMMHFLTSPERFRLRPALYDFSIPDDVLSADDPWPTLGRIASLVALVRDRDLRAMVRG